MQHIFVGGTHRVRNQPVAHITAVHVHVLLVGARTRCFGQAGSPSHGESSRVQRHWHALRREVGPEHIEHTLRAAGATPLQDCLALVPGSKLDVRTRQRVAAHRLEAVGQLGRVALEEFAPRRCAEEQFAHLDAGAARARSGLQLAAAGVEPMRVLGGRGAAGQLHLGHRADGREGLAAKAHRRDRFKVGQRCDLAGGMAPQRERQFTGFNAFTVVFDDRRAHAAAAELDDHLAGAGVQGVVDQFAHHRGGPLDHLAGGDLADQFIVEFADRPAQLFSLGQAIHARIVESARAARRRHRDNRSEWNTWPS